VEEEGKRRVGERRHYGKYNGKNPKSHYTPLITALGAL
jgi:hypothetical protein